MRTRTIRIRTRERTEESVIICRDNALGELASAPPAMIFTDSNVDSLYRETIGTYFPGTPVHVMPAGEENKTPETLFALLSAMAEAETGSTEKVPVYLCEMVNEMKKYAKLQLEERKS